MIINQSRIFDRYYLVKFEDMVADPFSTAKKLYEFLEVEQIELKMIRLKSKKTIQDDNEYKVQYGTRNKHYWFPKKNIKDILNPNINTLQKKLLNENQKKDFEKEAKSVLDYFDYGS